MGYYAHPLMFNLQSDAIKLTMKRKAFVSMGAAVKPQTENIPQKWNII